MSTGISIKICSNFDLYICVCFRTTICKERKFMLFVSNKNDKFIIIIFIIQITLLRYKTPYFTKKK